MDSAIVLVADVNSLLASIIDRWSRVVLTWGLYSGRGAANVWRATLQWLTPRSPHHAPPRWSAPRTAATAALHCSGWALAPAATGTL